MFIRIIVFCTCFFVVYMDASASTEVSWARIGACDYEKNKTEKLLEDINYISKILANKHRSGSLDYSDLDKILTAIFAPHPKPLSEDVFSKVGVCSARMRVSLIKRSASHAKGNNNDWVACYQKLFPEGHDVIRAVKRLDYCMSQPAI